MSDVRAMTRAELIGHVFYDGMLSKATNDRLNAILYHLAATLTPPKAEGEEAAPNGELYVTKVTVREYQELRERADAAYRERTERMHDASKITTLTAERDQAMSELKGLGQRLDASIARECEANLRIAELETAVRDAEQCVRDMVRPGDGESLGDAAFRWATKFNELEKRCVELEEAAYRRDITIGVLEKEIERLHRVSSERFTAGWQACREKAVAVCTEIEGRCVDGYEQAAVQGCRRAISALSPPPAETGEEDPDAFVAKLIAETQPPQGKRKRMVLITGKGTEIFEDGVPCYCHETSSRNCPVHQDEGSEGSR